MEISTVCAPEERRSVSIPVNSDVGSVQLLREVPAREQQPIELWTAPVIPVHFVFVGSFGEALKWSLNLVVLGGSEQVSHSRLCHRQYHTPRHPPQQLSPTLW